MASVSNLSKMISSNRVKTYADTILIKKDIGYYTDGRALIIAQNLDLNGNGIYNKKFSEQDLNYPSISEFLPEGKCFSINCKNLFDYTSIITRNGKAIYLGLDEFGGKDQEVRFFCSFDNYCPLGLTMYFNLSRIIKFIKVFSGTRLADISTYIYPYDKCLCIFAGDYQMVFPSEAQYPEETLNENI